MKKIEDNSFTFNYSSHLERQEFTVDYFLGCFICRVILMLSCTQLTLFFWGKAWT